MNYPKLRDELDLKEKRCLACLAIKPVERFEWSYRGGCYRQRCKICEALQKPFLVVPETLPRRDLPGANPLRKFAPDLVEKYLLLYHGGMTTARIYEKLKHGNFDSRKQFGGWRRRNKLPLAGEPARKRNAQVDVERIRRLLHSSPDITFAIIGQTVGMTRNRVAGIVARYGLNDLKEPPADGVLKLKYDTSRLSRRKPISAEDRNRKISASRVRNHAAGVEVMAAPFLSSRRGLLSK